MRIRLFTSIAIFVLALGLTGCRVQSVLVMPSLTPYSYAAPGQTLEWIPYDPKAAPIYVVFDGAPPCEKPYYQVGPKPAQCKVLKGHNGYFTYHFDTQPPPPGGDKTILQARSCPYCQIAIDPGDNNRAVLPKVIKSKDATGYSLNVGCDKSGGAVVTNPPVGVIDNDLISWVPLYPNTGLKVTTSNICSGSGVFAANEVCTVTGQPSAAGQPSVSYTYNLHLDQCDGSSNITINPPPAP
jgi:hypothetical protein